MKFMLRPAAFLFVFGLVCLATNASLAQIVGGGVWPGTPGGGGGGGSTTLAFDATSETGINFSSSVSSLTWSHVVDTGAVGNPFLYVAVITYSATARTTSTVTYNGASCSKIDALTAALEGNNQETTHWACAAPTQGTHNIVATLSGTADFAMAMAESLTGAAQSAPVDSHNIDQTVGSAPTSASISTTVVATGTWLVGFAWSRASPSPVLGGTGTTIRLAPNPGAGGTAVGIGDSNGTVGTGSQALNYNTATDGGTWPGYTIASIKHGP